MVEEYVESLQAVMVQFTGLACYEQWTGEVVTFKEVQASSEPKPQPTQLGKL